MFKGEESYPGNPTNPDSFKRVMQRVFKNQKDRIYGGRVIDDSYEVYSVHLG